MNLNQEKNSNTILNKGYACLWIAEYAFKFSNVNGGLHFLKYCLNCWEKEAPIKALKVRNDFDEIIKGHNATFFATLTNWDIEKFCNSFVENGLKQSYF